MEDLFWKFYCCKWKLTSWCFNVDPQKPLGIIHKGDVEEKMAASPPNPESRQAKSEDRLVGTGKTVFKSFQTDSEWRLKLQSLSPLMRKVKHLGLGFYSLFFFLNQYFVASEYMKCLCRCVFRSKFPSLLLFMSGKEHDFFTCIEWLNLITGKF